MHLLGINAYFSLSVVSGARWFALHKSVLFIFTLWCNLCLFFLGLDCKVRFDKYLLDRYELSSFGFTNTTAEGDEVGLSTAFLFLL